MTDRRQTEHLLRSISHLQLQCHSITIQRRPVLRPERSLPHRPPTIIIIITRCKYFDPCYARATVVRARFLAAAFSDGSYLAHVNGAYLRHVTFCIVRGPPLFIVSPISQLGPASVRGQTQWQAGPKSTTATLKGLNKRAVEYNLRPLF